MARIKRNTYYYWTKHMDCPDKYTKVKEVIQEIYPQTEFSHFGQKLYLPPILDLFNSEVISYIAPLLI